MSWVVKNKTRGELDLTRINVTCKLESMLTISLQRLSGD